MKKKVIGLLAFFAIATIATWNYNQNKKLNYISEITLENIEALADEEGSTIGFHLFPCPHTPWNECKFCESERPICAASSYC